MPSAQPPTYKGRDEIRNQSESNDQLGPSACPTVLLSDCPPVQMCRNADRCRAWRETLGYRLPCLGSSCCACVCVSECARAKANNKQNTRDKSGLRHLATTSCGFLSNLFYCSAAVWQKAKAKLARTKAQIPARLCSAQLCSISGQVRRSRRRECPKRAAERA